MRALILLGVLLAPAAAQEPQIMRTVFGGATRLEQQGFSQPLSEKTFAQLRAQILPSAEELRWREIPWRAALWPALAEAAAADKPVLLWAMNGHPLACT